MVPLLYWTVQQDILQAGVEAQTLTVWRQCDSYGLPRLIYINKMDRHDANIDMCIKSIREKLEVDPVCLQFPVKDMEGKLKGVVDLINLDVIYWDIANKGKRYIRQKLTEKDHGQTWEKAVNARNDLTDVLSGHDDKLADVIINSNSMDDIAPSSLTEAVKRTTLALKTFPVICGSSYKNVGVQTLMDSIVDFLPSPSERNEYYNCFGDNLSAKAFKVQHDDRKGVLTFFRIYTGKLKKGQKIFNINKEISEQGNSLYIPYADEYESTTEILNGNVAVISDLKATMTGDTITSSQSIASNAKENLMKKLSNPENLQLPPHTLNKISSDPEESASTILGIGTIVPEPVFLCSIEPPSLSYQTALDKALLELQREDSSLRVTNNTDTGQTVLSGMGELHLDIIKERIRSEYKIEVELGPLQIAYKETINSSSKLTHVLENKIGNSKQFVKITLSAYPSEVTNMKSILKLDNNKENASNLSMMRQRQLNSIKLGIESALINGPNMGCPMVNIGVTIHWLEVGRGTSDTFISAATTQCLRKIFAECESSLLEPVMFVEIVCPEDYSNGIITDLTKRRSVVNQICMRGHNKVIETLTPLSELMGYSSYIRCLSSGRATFTMEFHSNQEMSQIDQEKAIANIRGF
ncbi:mitochondrial ribosome recycling factor 2 isoform X2 [Arctopsyche grandis]|uniref:mitochondrial ribosome recycling factor 2 isoform X2 n=1 Tax=Arctopsyche grandis TaxID=121162 RepID=UPI00406D65E6